MMKKFIFGFILAFAMLFTSCTETEVPVDEMRIPVEISVLQPDNDGLVLKSARPTSLDSYPWISGLDVTITPPSSTVFNKSFVFDGSNEPLVINCPPGNNTLILLPHVTWMRNLVVVYVMLLKTE